MLVTEILQEQASGLVVAHDSDRQNVHSQVGKIVDGIRSAAGQDRALAMLQDQHRSFARHARDFAEDEFVGHKIAEHSDGDLRETPRRFSSAARLLWDAWSYALPCNHASRYDTDSLMRGVFVLRSCASMVSRALAASASSIELEPRPAAAARKGTAQVDGVFFGGDKTSGLAALLQFEQLADVFFVIGVMIAIKGLGGGLDIRRPQLQQKILRPRNRTKYNRPRRHCLGQ